MLGPELMRRLDRIDLHSRKLFPGRLPGERRSKKRGQSVEFDDYRPYVHGDDLRRIDWKVYARLDRVVLKLFLEEEDLALHIALDASASMDAGGEKANKLLFCQRLAMALGYLGLVNQNRVSISVFGGRRLERLPEMRGRRHVQRLGQFLLNVASPGQGNPGAGADFNSALRTIAMSRQGKGVMVVLSDFLVREGYEEGLKTLAGAGGYDTWCLQVLSPGEIDPTAESDEDLSGGVVGDLRLTDIESGASAEVTVSGALIKRYRERLEEYCANLSSYCAAREMAHMIVRSDSDIATLLLEDLRKRGLLR